MLNYITNMCLSLKKPLRTVDTSITVPTAQALQLNKIGIGNHTYFELWYNGNTEVVRYDHTATIPSGPQLTTVAILRDVEGTGNIYNFPNGISARVGPNKSTLVELIQQATV